MDRAISPHVCGVSLCCLSLVLGACRIAAPTEADDVRRENAALKERVALLEARSTELETKLAARAATSEAAEIAAATPVVAGIEIDRFSGLSPADAESATRRFTVYVAPFDGRRRFTQAVGTLMAELRAQDGTVIASRSLSVTELRESYRSQFGGTYYVVSIDVPAPQSNAVTSLRAELVDLLTGARHESARNLVPPQRPH